MKVETTIQEAASNKPTRSGDKWRVSFGKLGERKAIEYLQQLGWDILAVNWRCGRYGELDIVARDDSRMLVFCEVKTRLVTDKERGIRNECFESVHWKKRNKIITIAMNYMRSFKAIEKSCRFDVIAIEYRNEPNANIRVLEAEVAMSILETARPVIRHVQGAFC